MTMRDSGKRGQVHFALKARRSLRAKCTCPLFLSRVGCAAFVLGLLWAVTAAAKTPPPGETWPDTTPLFAAGLAACIAGLIGWRIGIRREHAAGRGNRLGSAALLRLIAECRGAIERLSDEFDSLDSRAARVKIDSLMETYFEPFVENRFALIECFGMRHGAAIMLRFAHVERYLNRVWSAASDDCPAAARAALDESLRTFAGWDLSHRDR